MTPFRSEKNTNWEGAFRVPEMIRWPGKIAAGSSRTRSSSTTTGCRRSSPPPATPDVVEKLKAGHEIGGTTFKVHIDGYNLLPVPDRRGRQEPATGVRLLLRRRRRARAPLRQLEGRLHGAAGAGNDADLGRAVRGAARPEALQPAHRSVRARRHDVEHLLRLVHRQRLHRAGRDGDRRRSSWRRSRSSRRGRRRRASRSTRSSRSSRLRSRRDAEHGPSRSRPGTTGRRRRPCSTSSSA